jgi:hypothetical protein
MTKLGLVSVLAAFALPLMACGDDDDAATDSTDDSAQVDAGNPPPGPDAAPDPEGWEPLLSGGWTIPKDAPDREPYYCVRVTLTEDTPIKAFRPISPLGTHHTVLTIDNGSKPDGTEVCGPGTNGNQMIYGSGVGSPSFAFPAGVGLKLRKGTQLLLNLHTYNATDNDLSGVSGVEFQRAQPNEIVHEAEVVLAGPVGFMIPPTAPGQVHKLSGECKVESISNEPIHVFAKSAHMHKRGRHLKTVVKRGAENIVIQDTDYDFDSQSFTYMDPLFTLQAGDIIRTTCSFDNETNGPVYFGDSSDTEMCFTDIFYYPAQNANFLCADLTPEVGE